MLPELLEEILLHKRRGDTDIARDYNNTRLWQEANKQKNSESNSILCCETSLLSNTGKAAASLLSKRHRAALRTILNILL